MNVRDEIVTINHTCYCINESILFLLKKKINKKEIN